MDERVRCKVSAALPDVLLSCKAIEHVLVHVCCATSSSNWGVPGHCPKTCCGGMLADCFPSVCMAQLCFSRAFASDPASVAESCMRVFFLHWGHCMQSFQCYRHLGHPGAATVLMAVCCCLHMQLQCSPLYYFSNGSPLLQILPNVLLLLPANAITLMLK